MGWVTVEVGGSFNRASRKGHKLAGGTQSVRFAARTHGHAHAVQEAISYLVDTVLPVAINLDHELQSDGDAPDGGFEKPYPESSVPTNPAT